MRIHTRFPFLVVATFAGAVFPGGCSSDAAAPPLPPVDPRSCSANWRAVYSPEQGVTAPFGLTHDAFIRAHGDRIFVNPATLGPAPAGIRSVPASGGPATLAYAGWARAFWIEDDQLVVAAGSTLQSLPLAGGDARTILTTHAVDDPMSLVSPWELDRQALYWGKFDYVDNTVWRAPRDGSGEQKLATLPKEEGVESLALGYMQALDDGRLFVSTGRRVWTVPKSGGDLQEHALADGLTTLLGVASDGTMLWTRFAGNSDPNHPRYALVRLRVDDAAPGPDIITFDALSVSMQNATPAGTGGFYILAWEYGTDGGIHTTAWALDAADNLTRIACDPEIERLPLGGAGTPDTFYPVVERSLQDWQVAAVSRSP